MEPVYNPFALFAYRVTLVEYQQHVPFGGVGGFVPKYAMDMICENDTSCAIDYIRFCMTAGGDGGCFPHPNNPDKTICWCNPPASSSIPTQAMDVTIPGMAGSVCKKPCNKYAVAGCNDGGGHMCKVPGNESVCKCCPGAGANLCT